MRLGDWLSQQRQKPPPDDDQLPVVPFVPFRCPDCRRHKPRTEGVRGRTRWHTCMACGRRYKSLEVDPQDIGDSQRLREIFGEPP